MRLEKGKCRGCQADVPKGRQTWCSRECYHRHDLRTIKHKINERSGGKCELCGEWVITNRRSSWDMTGAEIAAYRARRRPEYDHVIAFRDGGQTVLENMRLLCSECHKERTAQQRKEWAKHEERTGDQRGA